MKAGQALDVHGLLLEVLESSEMARGVLDVVAERQGQIGGSVANVVINHLRVAETFHVAETVTRLVSSREAKLKATATFGEFVPPTPCGVLVLDEPIRVFGTTGVVNLDLVGVSHMITWGPARFQDERHRPWHGTCVVLWHDNRREGGQSRPLGLALGADETLGMRAEQWVELIEDTAGLLPVAVLAMTSEVRLGPSLVKMPVKGQGTMIRSPLRILCTLWQLMDETITVIEDAPKFGGAHRRRAERRGHKPRVTVVTLRRTSAKGIEGARGPLSEVHDVRGHWRTYWVGSGADRHEEKRWITAHESPKDRPDLPKAVHTEKVYTLRR